MRMNFIYFFFIYCTEKIQLLVSLHLVNLIFIMRLLNCYLSIIILLNLSKLSFSDVTFEIRSDIEVVLRLSLRPSPIRIIRRTGKSADMYCKNFKEIIRYLSPKEMTALARTSLQNLDAQTAMICRESQRFFNNDYMTVWYNKLRRITETNYVFTDMYAIIDKFLATMNSKKAPRCWNRFRDSVKNITQYYVVTVAYNNLEKFMFNKFMGYGNESKAFNDNLKKIGAGSSATFFVSIYAENNHLHNINVFFTI